MNSKLYGLITWYAAAYMHNNLTDKHVINITSKLLIAGKEGKKCAK